MTEDDGTPIPADDPGPLPRPLVETFESLAASLDRVSRVLDKERKGRRIGMIAITVGLVMTASASGLGWATLRDAQAQVAVDRCVQINETRVDTRDAIRSSIDEILVEQGARDDPRAEELLDKVEARVRRDLPERNCRAEHG